MPLISGDFDAIGDVFVLQLDAIQKVVSFDSFVDGVTGETGTRFFDKEFRTSRDGFVWTPYQVLTDPNLNALDTSNMLTPWFLEVRYTRGGTSTIGTLRWDFFVLNVTQNLGFDTKFCPKIFTNPNLFCELETDDLEFIELCANLTDKLIKYGVVPKYISQEDGERSEDYAHYWKTICCFLSLCYIFAKNNLGEIYDTQLVLVKFLTERGIYLCGDETLLELQPIANEYYNVVRRRGTENVEPEIRRLLCVGDCDEFVFAFVPNFSAGWVLDNSSPLYTGLQGIETVNKLPKDERGDDVVDIANYHIINPAGLSIITEAKNNGDPVEAIFIDNVSATTGIMQNGADISLAMVVDPTLNYEMVFSMKQEVLGAIITFGLLAWDENDVLIVNPTENIITGLDDNYFFQTSDVMDQTTEFVQIRGIIFNKDEPNKSASEGLMSFGYGKNLRLKQEVCKVYPIIVVENGITVPGNATKIYGVRVALSSNPFSLGFVGLANFILTYFNNQNPSLTDEEVDEIVDRFLIPMNATLQTVNL